MKKHYLACLLCLFFLFALPVQGFAVAGGHGGGSTRSGGSGGSFGGSSVGHHFYDDRPIIGRSRGYYRSSSYGDVEDYVLMGPSVGGFAAFALFKRKKEQHSVTRELFSRMPGKRKRRKDCFQRSKPASLRFKTLGNMKKWKKPRAIIRKNYFWSINKSYKRIKQKVLKIILKKSYCNSWGTIVK